MAIFLLSLPLINPYLRSDGIGYYAYLRSLVIDGDLQFENEYRHGDLAWMEVKFPNGELTPDMRTSNGHVSNHWAVGPSLFWAPFFLAAHSAVVAYNRFLGFVRPDGFSFPYLWLCALGTAFYGFMSLLLGYRLAKTLFPTFPALLATIGIWFASSLPVYMYFLPFHAHALSSFTVALFVWQWVKINEQPALSSWAWWGALAGIMIDTYYLAGIFLLLPLMECCRAWLLAKSKRKELYAMLAGKGLSFLAGLVLALLPNFLAKWVIYGSALQTGYQREWFFFSEPRLWQVGFSAEHGLFLWTPVLLFSVVGLLLIWRYNRWLSGNLLLCFGVYYYVVASYQYWHGISSFGNRFFVSLTPIFVLGLATSVHEATRFLGHVFSGRRSVGSVIFGFRPVATLYLVMLLLILWNVGFMFQWGTNVVPNRGPVDLAQVARNQLTLVPSTIAAFSVDYLFAREKTVMEVERKDLEELPGYHQRR